MSYDIWQDFEKMRQDLTDNTHISRKALEAMLDAHKEVVAERDALAAHVERLQEAGEQAVNGFSLNGLGDTYESEDLLAALREAPKISRTKLKAQLRRHSTDPGLADQRRAESRAIRQALGFEPDADDVSPNDLLMALAHLKAQWQAEVLDEAAMDIRANFGHHTQYSVSLLASALDGMADSYRRQAEEGE